MTRGMLDAIRAAGLSPAKELDLRPDGQLIRFRVDGDKAGSRNGWAVLHDGPVLAGAFGSWRTGETHSWCSASAEQLSPAERTALQRTLRAAQQARRDEQAKVHAEARVRAEKLWARARPAHDDHPYLRRKGVPAIGVRQLRDALLVPARDAHGVLHTLQFIDVDGAKRFLTGGRIRGCYFAMGRPARCLLIAEGFATGCTLHDATGLPVAVAFNCRNLEAVARALRAKFPDVRLLLCADDDAATPGNPGVTHALAAARAVGGHVVIPKFTGLFR